MFQMSLMRQMRESIKAQCFPQFVQNFMSKMFSDGQYPKWVVDALTKVNINLQIKPEEVLPEIPNKKLFTNISSVS